MVGTVVSGAEASGQTREALLAEPAGEHLWVLSQGSTSIMSAVVVALGGYVRRVPREKQFEEMGKGRTNDRCIQRSRRRQG